MVAITRMWQGLVGPRGEERDAVEVSEPAAREPLLTRRPAARAEEPAGDGLTIGGILNALWRRKLAILTFTGLCGLVALGVLLSMRPQYEAGVRMLIEPAADIVPSGLASGGQQGRERLILDAEAVASQVELIGSRDVALRVIEELDLTGRLEFATPGPLESLLAVMGIAPDEASLTEQAMKSYSKSLRVFRIPDTRVIGIGFRSADPELAARGADAVARAYLAEQVRDKSAAAEAATDWLGAEIERLRERVADAERRVQAFRADAGLIRGANDTTLPAQRLSELNTQLARARALRIDAEGQAEQIRRALRSASEDGLVDAVNAPLMQRLMERQGDARAQLADVSSTLGPAHPRVRQLNAQLDDLTGQVRAEAQRLASQFDEDARTAQAREAALLAELESLQGEAADAEFQSVELRALEREAKAQRDLLESLLGRYREASARQNPDAQPADARIISGAAVPLEPAFPKTVPTLIAVVLGAFVLACGVVIAGAFLRGDDGDAEAERIADDPYVPLDDAPHVVPQHALFAEPLVADAETARDSDAEISSDSDAETESETAGEAVDAFEADVAPEDDTVSDLEPGDGDDAHADDAGESDDARSFDAPTYEDEADAPAHTASFGPESPFSQDAALRGLSASLNVPIATEDETDRRGVQDRASESLETIAERFAQAEAGRARVLVVSPGAPVAALTGLVLADAIAALGKGAICIDAGTHAPGRRLEDLLEDAEGYDAGERGALGLSDVAAGAPIEDAVRPLPRSGAHAMLGGTTRPNAAMAGPVAALLTRVYDALVLIADADDIEGLRDVPLDAAVLVSDGCDTGAFDAAMRALTAAGIGDVTVTSTAAAVAALDEAA